MWHRLASLRAFVLLLCLQSTSAWAGDQRLPLVGGGSLLMSVPDGWIMREEPGASPAFFVTPATDERFKIVISPVVQSDGATGPGAQDAIRKLVQESADKVRSRAIETSLPLQPFGSPSIQGAYFFATDRAPKPNEYRNLAQGGFIVDGLPVMFTLLSNGDPQPVLDITLRMLASMRRE